MKHSEAEAEIRDLLDQLAGETSVEQVVAYAMDDAMSACHVKKSRRPHTALVLQHFWARLKRAGKSGADVGG
jgi:hypothetical protein